jgi:starch synthase
MKILLAASELLPYAKTGGLADAVASLAVYLAKEGNEVRVVMPRYYCINKDELGLKQLAGPLSIPVGYGGEEWCAVYESTLPGSPAENPVIVYFVEYDVFYGRNELYGNAANPDFPDNPRRFTFLSRAVFQVCRKLKWYPDVFHANDWQTALVPVFLKHKEKTGPFAKSVSVLTIHNLGYQGIYKKENFDYTGLGWNVYYESGFEDFGMMNMLKAGIYTACKLNTVSEAYAAETKTQAGGFRLDGPLRVRSADYQGILNGIDRNVWNPAADAYIPAGYSVKDLSGKALVKAALQKEFGLPVEPNVPLIGMITRLTAQKGVGELFGPGYGSAYSLCRNIKLQLAIVGTGDKWCENEIRSLASRLPNIRAHIGFSERLSHMVEAGADFFLMPSRYEPCGLNQMYSLAYGTIPIVRNTGGLADTVENFNQEAGTGTGFVFNDLTPEAIYNTVGWAVWAYYNRKKDIKALRLRGMKQDHSWEQSARKYIEMYESAIALYGGRSEENPK